MLKVKDMHKCLWIRASRLGSTSLSSISEQYLFQSYPLKSMVLLVIFGKINGVQS